MSKNDPRPAFPERTTKDVGASPDSTTSLWAWIERVRGEYYEMPGLSLTERQGQRLWGLAPSTCRELFEILLASGFLRRTYQGQYIRADSFSPPPVARKRFSVPTTIEP